MTSRRKLDTWTFTDQFGKDPITVTVWYDPDRKTFSAESRAPRVDGLEFATAFSDLARLRQRVEDAVQAHRDRFGKIVWEPMLDVTLGWVDSKVAIARVEARRFERAMRNGTCVGWRETDLLRQYHEGPYDPHEIDMRCGAGGLTHFIIPDTPAANAVLDDLNIRIARFRYELESDLQQHASLVIRRPSGDPLRHLLDPQPAAISAGKRPRRRSNRSRVVPFPGAAPSTDTG